MAKASISFVGASPKPSFLIDGSHSNHALRQFVTHDLDSFLLDPSFLKVLKEASSTSAQDFGFADAIGLSIGSGQATLDHVIPDTPRYQLPIGLLVQIIGAWVDAKASSPSDFNERVFEIP